MQKKISILIFLCAFISAQGTAQCDGPRTISSQASLNDYVANCAGDTLFYFDLKIEGADISDLSGLSFIRRVTGRLDIKNCPLLTSLAGLENIHTVGDYFVINNNDGLTNLTGLEGLIQARGLAVINNEAITSLMGVSSVQSFSDGLFITDNPNLPDCAAAGICNYLAGNTTTDIKRNAPGCNSLTEVKNACADTGNPLICEQAEATTCTILTGQISDLNNTISNACGVALNGVDRVLRVPVTSADEALEIIVTADADVRISLLNSCESDGCITTTIGKRLTLNNAAIGEYYYVVDFTNVFNSAYTIQIKCGTKPLNNACDNAIPISCGQTYEGNTANAANLWQNDQLGCTQGTRSNNTRITKDLTHQFTISETMNVNIYFSYDGSQGVAAAFVYSACDVRFCLENSSAANNPIKLKDLASGIYYIVIETNDVLNYSLQMDCCESTTNNFSSVPVEEIQSIKPTRSLANSLKLDFFEIDLPVPPSARISNDLTAYTLLRIPDFNVLKRALEANDSKSLAISLPIDQNKTITLEVVEQSIFASNFIAKEKGSFGEKTIDFERPMTYFGKIANEKQSMAGLSFVNDRLIAIFSFGGNNYNLEYNNTTTNGDMYVLYKEKDYKKDLKYSCHIDDLEEVADGERSAVNAGFATASRSADPITLYLECDYQMYLANNSNKTTTLNFVNGLFNVVAGLFSDAGITMQLSEVVIWSEPDPYDAANQPNSASLLGAFSCVNKYGYNGRIGHLLTTTTNNLGGHANRPICSSCEPFFSQVNGVSHIDNSYSSDLTVYSKSVHILAHELGHQLGSQHTHACVWNGNNTPIDCCGADAGQGECDCNISSPPSGTIMSYCHLTSTGIDLSAGFHPQIAARMVELSTTCLSPTFVASCPVPDAKDLSAQVVSSTSVQLGTTLSADYYLWIYRLAGNNPWTFVEPSAANSYALNGLTAGANYEFGLSVYCSDCKCWGNWSFGCDAFPFNTTNSDPCTNDLIITDNPAEGDYLSGRNIITNSPGPIEVIGTAIFQAGTSISLLEGFHAKAGSSFTATIANCSQNLQEVSPSTLIPKEPIVNEINNTSKQAVGLQIFPNPFTTNTTLQFTLAQPTNIDLTLYNLNGQVMKTILSNKNQETGTHQVVLERRDLQAGIYYLNLVSNQEKLVKKIMIVH